MVFRFHQKITRSPPCFHQEITRESPRAQSSSSCRGGQPSLTLRCLEPFRTMTTTTQDLGYINEPVLESDSNSFNSTYSSNYEGRVNAGKIDLIPNSAQIQINFRLEVFSLAWSVDSFRMRSVIDNQCSAYKIRVALSTVPDDDYMEIAGLMSDIAYNILQIFASTGIDDERNPASSLQGLADDCVVSITFEIYILSHRLRSPKMKMC